MVEDNFPLIQLTTIKSISLLISSVGPYIFPISTKLVPQEERSKLTATYASKPDRNWVLRFMVKGMLLYWKAIQPAVFFLDFPVVRATLVGGSLPSSSAID